MFKFIYTNEWNSVPMLKAVRHIKQGFVMFVISKWIHYNCDGNQKWTCKIGLIESLDMPIVTEKIKSISLESFISDWEIIKE